MTNRKVERFKENPFLADMIVPLKGKQVQLSRLGKDQNILINQATGEENGTHVTTYKKVDGAQFVKLFTANIALTFDLTSPGIKVFSVLVWAMQKHAISRDVIDLDVHVLNDFVESHDNKIKLSEATYRRGLSELVKVQIIARHLRQGRYFINPNFVFNGDRIAFTTLIERQPENELESDS